MNKLGPQNTEAEISDPDYYLKGKPQFARSGGGVYTALLQLFMVV